MHHDPADPRTQRRSGGNATVQADLATSPFRVDRDRVASSPFFARLGGVTQVVSSTGSGLLVHNRLTHSLKVAQAARAIAERLHTSPDVATVLEKLGGCDPDVVEAASLAHDLGHPPFGHLGEQVLDRLARHRFGLSDGFEGNAQSFRIVTTTDVRGPAAVGLDLTVAVRAAMLKYPWTRLSYPTPHPRDLPAPPRGAAEPPDGPGTGSSKFSAYVTEVDDVEQTTAWYRQALGFRLVSMVGNGAVRSFVIGDLVQCGEARLRPVAHGHRDGAMSDPGAVPGGAAETAALAPDKRTVSMPWCQQLADNGSGWPPQALSCCSARCSWATCCAACPPCARCARPCRMHTSH